jgi:uncharacterized membrane protein YgaE (UPF0421/DUF939 family)
MKKTLLIVLFLMFGLIVQAQAANTNTNANKGNGSEAKTTSVTGTAQATESKSGNAVQTKEQNKVKNQGESTQIQTQEQNSVQEQGGTQKNGNQDKAEEHRSAVADFVQSLLSIADREGGIGQEVRTIANQQNEMRDRAADLIYAVENRSKVKTFLIGTSYRNVGELRSQMVQTRNQIEQLNRLMEKVENAGDKTELQNQIQVLEKEQLSINDFITQNESKFSLFGWAVKLFR